MFIAEIGINHNGDLDIALELIDEAVRAGADIVKFQKRNPDVCVPEHQKTKMRETPWGKMTYLEYKKRIEFGKSEYDLIDAYCKAKGIAWTVSVFDMDSLNFIMQYNIPFIKIASSSITDIKLLEAIADTGKDVIMSTGMSTFEEIDAAVSVFDRNKLKLLHCVSVYPTQSEELNLNRMCTLRSLYPDIEIGYSGHEIGFTPTLTAAIMGARIIERHVTLNCGMWGTDQSMSLEPWALTQLIHDIKQIPVWKGTGSIVMCEREQIAKDKLRAV